MTLATAKLLHASGVSTIPVKADKTPLVMSWKKYRTELPTDAELERWFAKGAGIALIAGKVQCVDFDCKYSVGIFDRYVKRAEECGLDLVIGQCILQSTPSGGYHLVFQCDGKQIGNLKLAQKENLETLIETRGDGGYFLISPSPNYQLLNGDWSSIPAITEDDRDALLTLAKTFDEQIPAEAEPSHVTAGIPSSDATPGDDFDFRADVPALLKQHGWKPAGSSGKYWTRPGKAKGISASWGVVPGRFFVFSSSTQFAPMHVYRPWHVYAMLECSGDYARAAGELRRQGFGGISKPKHSQPLPDDWNPPIDPQSPHAEPPGIEGIDPSGDAPTVETPDDKIRRLFFARRFDPEAEIPEPTVTFTLGGVPICTPGNLTAITAQAKVGKSALLQGFVAAMLTESPDVDCLGVCGHNADGKGCVYLDTEQSKYDFSRAMKRANKRAGNPPWPAWLKPYGIGDLPVATARQGLAIHIADAHAQFGAIHAVFIDGVADLVLDVNDAEECNGLVSELFTLATRYACSIIFVIHKNPGSDKTRGHLGSQLERKAETNLTLEKDDEVTVVWSVKQRGAPIFKKDGIRFAWSDDAGMHASVAGGAPKMTQTVEKWLLHAKTVFAKKSPLSFVDLRTALMTDAGSAISTVEKQIANLRKIGVLKIDSFGGYSFNDLQNDSHKP